MKKSKFSEEQIATALRQIDAGAPVLEVTRKLGISEATYDVWRKRYGQLPQSRDSAIAAAGGREQQTQTARGRSDLGFRSFFPHTLHQCGNLRIVSHVTGKGFRAGHSGDQLFDVLP